MLVGSHGGHFGIYWRTKEITNNERSLLLRDELCLSIQCEDGYYCIDFPDADIYIAEKTIEDAKTAFFEDFIFAWQEYAEADDSELSGDAIQLKHWLLSIVSSR
jgi:hypothetical protein